MPTTTDHITYDYPPWVKDDVDKALVDIMMNGEYSKTLIKNFVKERIIQKVSNMSLDDKIDHLISKGYLGVEDKTKNFKVLKIKKS